MTYSPTQYVVCVCLINILRPAKSIPKTRGLTMFLLALNVTHIITFIVIISIIIITCFFTTFYFLASVGLEPFKINNMPCPFLMSTSPQSVFITSVYVFLFYSFSPIVSPGNYLTYLLSSIDMTCPHQYSCFCYTLYLIPLKPSFYRKLSVLHH